MSTALPLVDPAHRRVYFVPHLTEGLVKPGPDSDSPDLDEERIDVGTVSGLEAMSYPEAGLVVSSRLVPEGAGDLHAPVIDLDFPARLVPSATPGHFHLYLDVALPWAKFVALLEAMATAGIVQPGYVAACTARGSTDVRAYPETKPTEDQS